MIYRKVEYDAIRLETARCIAQLQAVLRLDPVPRTFLIAHPVIELPAMDPDPLYALTPPPTRRGLMNASYFDTVRDKINQRTLRTCQAQAFAALANYFRTQGKHATCVMSVGAGKTALG
jgi:hypothetical protein